jgi:hypothetical protein
MTGYVFIERTVFQTLDEVGNVLGTSYGIRIYDNTVACCMNDVPSLDNLKALDPVDLIEMAREFDGPAADMLEASRSKGVSIMVDGREAYVPERANRDA